METAALPVTVMVVEVPEPPVATVEKSLVVIEEEKEEEVIGI